MPLYKSMILIPRDEYETQKDARQHSGDFHDSIQGDISGGQVNHIELGDGGRVTIKPTGGLKVQQGRQ